MKLLDVTDECFWRGAIFRCNAKWPYEDVVDFMLVETFDRERPLGLMVATGYKAGITFLHFPAEALVKGTVSISVAWLKANWEKWVYPHCPVGEVFFMEGYPPPISTKRLLRAHKRKL